MKKCINCGTELEINQKICDTCGSDIPINGNDSRRQKDKYLFNISELIVHKAIETKGNIFNIPKLKKKDFEFQYNLSD